MSSAITTNAFPAPAQMREITWAINPATNTYDIFNTFTDSGNKGNLEVIKSKILITLNVIQGEWAAQPSFGIPFNTIAQQSDNPAILAQIISNEILSVENVNNVQIVDLNYVATTRQFSGSFNVNTAFGVTSVTMGS